MHILVVDDKEKVVKMICDLLEHLEVTIETAVNGLDALAKAKKSDFDLYIVDHLMPVMNGIQLVKNLKLKEHSSSKPILFMTTQDVSSLEYIDEYKHFDAILAKPLNQDIFYQTINQLLPENTIVHSL